MAADGTTRTEKFPFGIASVGLGEVERQVPLDEPPPLPPNAELAVIGKPVPRQNGRAKVTGATRFTVDVALPGMLHGRILRSPLPHAEVRAIDVSAAARHPGVRAVLLVARPEDPATRDRALCRRAGRRGRRRFDGRRRRGAAPHPRRLQTAALRRGHGQGARADGAARSMTPLRRPRAIPRVSRAARPAAQRQCARTGNRSAAAMWRKASRKPMSSSKANIAPRCRPIAAWSRTRSSPIGGRTG